MLGIANNVQDFLNNSMKSSKLELNASGKTWGEVDIRREIFLGDSLSPLLFVLCMILLTWLLRRAKAGHEQTEDHSIGKILSEKKYGGTGLVSEKMKALFAELN